MMGLGNSPFGEAIFIVVFDRLPHKALETLCEQRQLFWSLRVKGLRFVESALELAIALLVRGRSCGNCDRRKVIPQIRKTYVGFG